MKSGDGIWRDRYRVRTYEVGTDAVSTIGSIANYLQESAANHAEHLGFSHERMMKVNRAWVLTRLRIRMKRYPAYHEEIRVETWPSGLEKNAAMRDFRIVNSNEHVIGLGTSAWVNLDLDTRKLAPFPQFLIDAYPPAPAHVLEFESRTVQRLKTAEYTRDYPVRECDLDMNRHVNNVRYIEWAVEAVPEGERAGKRLVEVDVLFRSESFAGNTVQSLCGALDKDGARLHSLQLAEKGTELARVHSRWEER